MLYYSTKARRSHVEKIEQLQKVINKIPGNVVSFEDASAINKYLQEYKELIIKELKGD